MKSNLKARIEAERDVARNARKHNNIPGHAAAIARLHALQGQQQTQLEAQELTWHLQATINSRGKLPNREQINRLLGQVWEALEGATT